MLITLITRIISQLDQSVKLPISVTPSLLLLLTFAYCICQGGPSLIQNRNERSTKQAVYVSIIGLNISKCPLNSKISIIFQPIDSLLYHIIRLKPRQIATGFHLL